MSDVAKEVYEKLMRKPKEYEIINLNTGEKIKLVLKPLPIGEYGYDLRKFFLIYNHFVLSQDIENFATKENIELQQRLIKGMLKISYPNWDNEIIDEIAFTYHDQLLNVLIDINAPVNLDRELIKRIIDMSKKRKKKVVGNG